MKVGSVARLITSPQSYVQPIYFELLGLTSDEGWRRSVSDARRGDIGYIIMSKRIQTSRRNQADLFLMKVFRDGGLCAIVANDVEPVHPIELASTLMGIVGEGRW